MRSILVVCEGNLCRSPMAQGLLSRALPTVHVSSAGLAAIVGMPADPIAVALLREREIDISQHCSAQISREMCLAADLILTMEAPQRERIQRMYPEVRGRVFRLSDDRKLDIPDPFRQSEQKFRSVLTQIDEGVRYWVRRVEQL